MELSLMNVQRVQLRAEPTSQKATISFSRRIFFPPGSYSVFANLTFRGPCIVMHSYNESEMHYFSNLFDKVLYMFRTGPLYIIRSI